MAKRKEFVLRVSAEIAEDLVPMMEEAADEKQTAAEGIADEKHAKKLMASAKRMNTFAGRLKRKLRSWHKENAL